MEQNRYVEILRLASNIELMLGSKEEKFVAFTTDSHKFAVDNTVGEIALALKEKHSVAVLSYEDVAMVEGVGYIKVSDVDDSIDSINEKCLAYDIILVIVPNMLDKKSYLHMATFTKELVIVAKKWSSKTQNITAIANMAKELDVNTMGIIYEK